MKSNNLLFIIIFTSIPFLLLSQRGWEFGVNFGFVTHNALDLPDDLRKVYSTESLSANLLLTKDFGLTKKVDIFGGVALNSFFFNQDSAYDIKNNSSHYISLLYGIRRTILDQKASLNFFVDHNILYSTNSVQHNKVFTNANFGLSYFATKKWLINVYLPVTLYPMFSHRNLGTINEQEITIYRSGVYNLGIYIGVSYLLQSGKDALR